MNGHDLFALGLGTMTATTLMTIFSYIIGHLRNSQFTEPVLLNRMLFRFGVLDGYRHEKNILGWIIHYAIGLLFLIIYFLVWSETRLDPTLQTAIILGCISGMAGIFGWSILFRLKSAPGDVKVSEYFAQLFIAHIIFALTATGTYGLLS